jgi:hypothetical protein
MASPTGPIQLFGTIQNSDGTPANGAFLLRLNTFTGAPPTTGTGYTGILPNNPIRVPVINGQVQQGISVLGNDFLQGESYYVVQFQTTTGIILFTQNWIISGTEPFDIASVIPISTAGLPSTFSLGQLIGQPGTPGTPGAAGTPGVASVVTSNGTNGGFTVPGLLNQLSTYSFSNSVPNSQVQYVEQLNEDIVITGSGFNDGNAGGWSASSAIQPWVHNYVRGIKHSFTSYMENFAEGDTAGIYVYVNSVGGPTALSDEAVTGINVEVSEYNTYMHGTISSTSGVGDHAPVINYTNGVNWIADGGVLLNISKGTISGNLTAPALPVNVDGTVGTGKTQAQWLTAYPTSLTNLPIFSAWGAVLNNGTNFGDFSHYVMPPTGRTADIKIPITLTVPLYPVQGTIRPFVVGQPIWIAGNNRVEQSVITAVQTPSNNTQTVTFNYAYYQQAAFLFQGTTNTSGAQTGLIGNYLSMDADLAFSGMRTSFRAIGSLDGTTLITMSNALGRVVDLAFSASTGLCAARCDNGPSSGFHLYPGAENVANLVRYGPPSLEPNAVNWQNGDTVEAPLPSYFGGHCGWLVKSQYSQTLNGYSSPCLTLDLTGTGVGSQSTMLEIVGVTNAPDDSITSLQFQDMGGPLGRPTVISLEGSFDAGLSFGTPPLRVISITNPPTVFASATSGSTQITVVGNHPSLAPYTQFRFDGVLPSQTLIESTVPTMIGNKIGTILTVSNPATQTVTNARAFVAQAIYHDDYGGYIQSLPDGSIRFGQIRPDYAYLTNVFLTSGNFNADDNTYVTLSNLVLRSSGNSNVPTRGAKDNSNQIASTQYVDNAVAAGQATGVTTSLQVTVPTGTKTLTITNGLITNIA